MSNWAESIWVVKRVRKFFEFDRTLRALNTSIENYTNQTGDMNNEIQRISDTLQELDQLVNQGVDELEDKIDNIQSSYNTLNSKADSLQNLLVNYIVISENSVPQGDFHENSLCFITQ